MQKRNYLFILAVLFSLFSCNKSDELQSDQGDNQGTRKIGPLLITDTTSKIYFTRNFIGSGRAEFYSVSNLGAVNPAVTLVAVGDKQFFPQRDVNRYWMMNNNTGEIWQSKGAKENIINKYSLKEYLSPPINSIENAVQNQQFGADHTEQSVIDYKNSKIYFLQSFPLKRIYSTDMDGQNEKDVPIPVINSDITCIDIDDTKGIIYYLDNFKGAIGKVNTDGTGNKILNKNVGVAHWIMHSKIKVDVEHNKMYWTTRGSKKIAIMSSDLDGNNITELWHTGYDSDTDIGGLNFEIDKANQKIFFIRSLMKTNTGFRDNLVRMDTNGANPKLIFSVSHSSNEARDTELFDLGILAPKK